MGEAEDMAHMFKVLSVVARVRIIDLLRRRSLCVNALSHILGVTPAAVSQHLRVLRDADLVVAEKRGYFVHYRINPAALERWGETARSLLAPSPEAGTAPGHPGGLPLSQAKAGRFPRILARKKK